MKHRMLPLLLLLLTLLVLLTACRGGPGGIPQDHMAPSVPASPQQDREAPAAGDSPAGTAGDNGTAAPAAALTTQQAVDIALDHAQVSEADTSFLHTEQDYEHGRLVYEVEFYVGQTEYKYEIDAATGEILDMEMERDHDH